MLIDCLSKSNLGANTVGARREQRVAKILDEAHVEKAGKSADATDDLRAVRGAHGSLHQFDSQVTGGRVYPRARI